MEYHVIGLMSGSSLDGLDIAYACLDETAGKWNYEIRASACIPYPPDWKMKLSAVTGLSARDYFLLHTAYGHYTGSCVNRFLEENGLNYRIQLIASHGHTAFHMPAQHTTVQLGDGAAIAALTGIRTITDLRSVDVALGGQGAPVVPIGEKLLFPEYDLFLNLGGIANLSANANSFTGFDVCPANKILNLLAERTEKGYDENGRIAATGMVDEDLLRKLNALPYYKQSFPKSLSNDFGNDEIYPLIQEANLQLQDALHTYVQHIACQIQCAAVMLKEQYFKDRDIIRLLVTGGGAHNDFLMDLLKAVLTGRGIECVVPDGQLIDYKEALVMALMGALRWREDVNVLSSVTGASKDSINGAVWSV